MIGTPFCANAQTSATLGRRIPLCSPFKSPRLKRVWELFQYSELPRTIGLTKNAGSSAPRRFLFFRLFPGRLTRQIEGKIVSDPQVVFWASRVTARVPQGSADSGPKTL